MRYLKFFIIGFFIIFIIQFGMLEFLEKIYLVDNASYSSSLVENNINKENLKQKLSIQQGAINKLVSFDGKYISYLKNSNLYILNLENGELSKISPETGMKISYYRWVYDRNRLILAERFTNLKDGSYFKLYYYDTTNKTKVEIFNETNNKSIRIPIYSSTENINTIDLSTLTNVMYVKMSNTNNYSRIYRINIMAEENSVNTVTHNIGRILSIKGDDTLLYEDLNNSMVFKYSDNVPISIEGHSNLRLLGIDGKDNVYLALTNSNKTEQIYYGNVSTLDWKTLSIGNTVDISDIYVNSNGQIFINDNSKSTLKELFTRKELYYGGKIIGMYNNGIISEKNNKIIIRAFQ